MHRDHECDVHDGLRHLGPLYPESTGPGQRRGRPAPDYRRVGGLTGSLIYPRLEQRLGRLTLVRAGLVIEASTHLVLALTQSAAVAYVTMALFGVHAVVWGTVAVTVRQRATPDRLQGRVTSVYLLGSLGGAAVGSVTGGLIGQGFGLTAPFWIAATGVLILTIVVWRPVADLDNEPV